MGLVKLFKLRLFSIFIVEDEQDLVYFMKEFLEGKGFEVEIASKALDALTILKDKRFDCILADMRLELGHGELVISTLRKEPENPNYRTPILVMSGFFGEKLQARLKDSFQDYLDKPFKNSELLAKVHRLCGIRFPRLRLFLRRLLKVT